MTVAQQMQARELTSLVQGIVELLTAHPHLSHTDAERVRLLAKTAQREIEGGAPTGTGVQPQVKRT